MAKIEDLESAVAAVGQALTRLQGDVTTIIGKLQTSGQIPDADVQSLVAVAEGIGQAADAIEAAVNPPTTPA